MEFCRASSLFLQSNEVQGKRLLRSRNEMYMSSSVWFLACVFPVRFHYCQRGYHQILTAVIRSKWLNTWLLSSSAMMKSKKTALSIEVLWAAWQVTILSFVATLSRKMKSISCVAPSILFPTSKAKSQCFSLRLW